MLKRFAPLVGLVIICWAAFVVNNLLWGGQLNRHGIVPRHLSGLVGIFWAPFLHGSLKHLIANTVPLLVLGGIICGRSRAEFGLVTIGGIVLGGGLTWLIARNASHIGASGLVFCFFGYLASMALFRRTFGSLLVAVVCLFAYGGILRGLLPGANGVSWEGHAAGLAAGIALAWISANLTAAKSRKTVVAPAPLVSRLSDQ